jgi:5-methyltetrahydrofolate--homocysteine methyltransferase
MVACDRILHAAREHGAQAVGLSGLITPSLEEMSHVAAEMERLGFANGADGGPPLPLLIGGATTSRAHTAIKIAPNYSGPVVYVPMPRARSASSPACCRSTTLPTFRAELAADYEKVRAQHANKKGITLVPLAAARSNRFAWNGDAAYRPNAPRKPGIHVLREVDLATLTEYIDWGPFFQTWDLAGSYPKILDDAVVGPTARAVFSDAQAMLQKVVSEKWLSANAVFGLFPANAVGDDIEIYADEDAQRAADDLAQPSPAAGAAGGQAALLPERFRRRTRYAGLDRGLCRRRRLRHRGQARRVRRRSRRLPCDHVEGDRRPPGRSLCRVAARAGAT